MERQLDLVPQQILAHANDRHIPHASIDLTCNVANAFVDTACIFERLESIRSKTFLNYYHLVSSFTLAAQLTVIREL